MEEILNGLSQVKASNEKQTKKTGIRYHLGPYLLEQVFKETFWSWE
jgi:hypothetical protein